MKIACLLYDGFTALDIVGPFDVLSRIPGAETFFVAKEKRAYRNDNGLLALVADRSLDEEPSPEILVVPGGTKGTRVAAADPEILQWVRGAHESTQCTASVCTGALILGNAGLLEGLTATTHWAAQEELEATGATYLAERWVRHPGLITAAGVSAGIDMALALVAEVAGSDLAEVIQLAIEYDPAPPFDSGSLAKARPEIVKALREFAF